MAGVARSLSLARTRSLAAAPAAAACRGLHASCAARYDPRPLLHFNHCTPPSAEAQADIIEARRKVFGIVEGNGLRSGRKVLRKNLYGATIRSYYPTMMSDLKMHKVGIFPPKQEELFRWVAGGGMAAGGEEMPEMPRHCGGGLSARYAPAALPTPFPHAITRPPTSPHPTLPSNEEINKRLGKSKRLAKLRGHNAEFMDQMKLEVRWGAWGVCRVGGCDCEGVSSSRSPALRHVESRGDANAHNRLPSLPQPRSRTWRASCSRSWTSTTPQSCSPPRMRRWPS